jgi:hypothetical protein
MNDLGTLATNIVELEFSADSERFPVSYVSGWLDANIGELNILLNECFQVDEAGDFLPPLCKEEEAIFTELYIINVYERMSRDVLRGIASSSSSSSSSDWVMLKEGDTTIQKQNKNSIARTLNLFKQDSMSRLDELVAKYNIYKASPLQVYGADENNNSRI